MNLRALISPVMFLQLGAALCYATGGAFMKVSAGLTHLRPTLLMFLLFGVAVCFQTLSMKLTTMGTGYVLVLGLEAFVALLVSLVYFREPYTVRDIIGVLLILIGTVTLKIGAPGT